MQKVAHLILWALILCLLAFTAVRTLHFLGATFPADQQYMPYLGLAAFDGGVLLWFMFAKYAAKGWQRAIAYLMVFACLAGVIICTWSDMFMVASVNGLVKLPANIANNALVGVIVIILLNVVMGVITHMVSPESLRAWQIESAHDRIEEQTMKSIGQSSVQIAPDIAAQLAQQWQLQTYQNMMLPIPEALPPVQQIAKKKGGVIGGGKELINKLRNGSKPDQGKGNQDSSSHTSVKDTEELA